MDDLISRQAAIDEMSKMYHAAEKWLQETKDDTIKARAESCMATLVEMKLRAEKLPSAERRGKWIEKHHAYSDEEMPIEEWQSARCSVCGKYHTTPYLYYFTEYKFCPNCGAKMITDKDDTQ